MDLNKRLLGRWVLIQDQLCGDGTGHLRQFVLYNDHLQTKVLGFDTLDFDLSRVKKIHSVATVGTNEVQILSSCTWVDFFKVFVLYLST